MDFHRFESHARAVFDEVPPDFREGVDGIEISRATVLHPSLPGVYTLGECKTEQYPTEFGVGDVRSLVVLYYGSFLALSREDHEWSWEEEIWETITHEIRHHLESLATEDELEELDYAEDQNFARREGERFDPHFYRLGTAVEAGAWEVDGDLFIEVTEGAGEDVAVPWNGAELRLPRPVPLGDVHFLRLQGLDWERGEVVAVLHARRSWREKLAWLLRPRPLEVLESTSEVPAGG